MKKLSIVSIFVVILLSITLHNVFSAARTNKRGAGDAGLSVGGAGACNGGSSGASAGAGDGGGGAGDDDSDDRSDKRGRKEDKQEENKREKKDLAEKKTAMAATAGDIKKNRAKGHFLCRLFEEVSRIW